MDPVAELKLHTFKIASQDNDGLIVDPATPFSAKTLTTSHITKGLSAFNPIVGPNTFGGRK